MICYIEVTKSEIQQFNDEDFHCNTTIIAVEKLQFLQRTVLKAMLTNITIQFVLSWICNTPLTYAPQKRVK